MSVRDRHRLRGIAALVAIAGLAGACARQPATPPPVPPAASSPHAPGGAAPPPSSPPVPGEPGRVEAPAAEGEPWITVGLGWDLNGVTIDPEAEAIAESPGLPQGRRAIAGDEQLAVTLESGHATVRAVAGRVQWSGRLNPGDTLTVTPDQGTTIRWKEQQWRGQFRVFLNPRGKLTLATRLRLESYLEGVVPGEIGPLADDLVEAGRAQAIAARSYTLFYRGRRAAEGFDVYGTVEDQLYVGVEGERPLATRCVQSTVGEVALSGGRPVRANYYSTCGGITAEVWEAWPADPLPYLVSHRDRPPGDTDHDDYCAGSKQYRWVEEWPAADFLADLTEYGPPNGVPLPSSRPGTLLDVRVDARSHSGRVWRLLVDTSTGEIAIPAWSLRQVLRRPGSARAILRSTLFKVDVRRDPRTDRVVSVVMSGAGSGHGVGLCQTGALGMARDHRSAEEILRHYYPGADVRRLY
jgi:stage II sporulation protein D